VAGERGRDASLYVKIFNGRYNLISKPASGSRGMKDRIRNLNLCRRVPSYDDKHLRGQFDGKTADAGECGKQDRPPLSQGLTSINVAIQQWVAFCYIRLIR